MTSGQGAGKLAPRRRQVGDVDLYTVRRWRTQPRMARRALGVTCLVVDAACLQPLRYSVFLARPSLLPPHSPTQRRRDALLDQQPAALFLKK